MALTFTKFVANRNLGVQTIMILKSGLLQNLPVPARANLRFVQNTDHSILLRLGLQGQAGPFPVSVLAILPFPILLGGSNVSKFWMRNRDEPYPNLLMLPRFHTVSANVNGVR